MNLPLLHFSGLQGDTGAYAVAPSPARALLTRARGKVIDREDAGDLQEWRARGAKGLLTGDPRDLSQAGWGVIFTQGDEKEIEAVREALQPLLDLRRAQVGSRAAHRYREFHGPKGFREGDDKRKFLTRFGAVPGAADPESVPYYLLIVGDPRKIPYEFQHLLDVERAVGRICFESLEEYDFYARTVVAAEAAMAARSRRAVFFAPRNPGDVETGLCVDRLTEPLAARLTTSCPGWDIQRVLGDDASKQRLARILGGEETPDLLFTAGHGMVFRPEDPRQLPHQGALVCRDWPGPSWEGRVPKDFYFSADDLDETARLRGLIAFFFACYSGGAPTWKDYHLRSRVPAAPHPFVARLPDRLLAHPRGGALAVIGHVDLAWVNSFDWPGVGTHIEAFAQVIEQILRGAPVGLAMEVFGRRYAELATELCEELLEVQKGKEPDEETSFRLCVCHDARNYLVLGDPAVRLVPPETVSPEPGR